MEIRKYKCKHCNVEHIDKTYENKSEALADIFVEASFKKIWEDFNKKHKEMPMENFCREFVFEYLYHFHRNLKRIRVDKRSIKHENGRFNASQINNGEAEQEQKDEKSS